MQNKLFQKILCFSLLNIAAIAVNAQNGQNMKIHFIAPTAVITANFPGSTNTSGISLPTGYGITEITPARVAAFNNVAPTRCKYVFQQLQPGTDLRRRVNMVQYISRDSVQVNYYLVDDRTGFTPNASGNFNAERIYSSAVETDTLLHVWPTGNGFSWDNNRRFQGRVRLGEYQMDKDAANRTGGVMAIQELVLHESFHTQLINRWTKWNGYITYGANSGHTIDEILGDQEAAINEGSGTFYGYTVNAAGLGDLDNFFADASHRYVLEALSVCAGYPELYTVAARQPRTVSGQSVFMYRWMDLPGFFCMFNENNATAFFANFWRSANGNRDKSLQFMNSAFNAMWKDTLKRYMTYACNRMALEMEAYNASSAGAGDATKTSSIFPFAVLDLVTHFGMSDAEYQADYRRNYPNREPRAFTEYFTNRRSALRERVWSDLTANPIRFQAAVDKAVEFCKLPANMF